MKKSLYLLAALSLFGGSAFAKEVVTAPATVTETITSEPATGEIKEEILNEDTQTLSVVEIPQNHKWIFSGRAYIEFEDFDNSSPLIGGDDEDGSFFGTGISASRDKLTLDLNVERRIGGDIGIQGGDGEWKSLRADWKIRYQLFESQAFHFKYRNEQRTIDLTGNAPAWRTDWTRDRFELGTDFNHFNGLLGGWLVGGYDIDKSNDGLGEDNGWYWEGDFGPSFKLTDKLSLNPTIFTTGEFYDSYEMVETQIRVMMPYQVNDKLTIMPRVRLTLHRNFDDADGNKVYEYEFGDRIRCELLANYTINDKWSTFVGVAYEFADRKYVDGGKKDIDLFWSYFSLNYKFN